MQFIILINQYFRFVINYPYQNQLNIKLINILSDFAKKTIFIMMTKIIINSSFISPYLLH
jgi:hypothetical protein